MNHIPPSLSGTDSIPACNVLPDRNMTLTNQRLWVIPLPGSSGVVPQGARTEMRQDVVQENVRGVSVWQ
jgi:hypothetical protein